MVCTTYYAAASPPPPPPAVPAPVLSVTAIKQWEGTGGDSVRVTATFGSGTASPSAAVKVDGIQVMWLPRQPDGTSYIDLTIAKDGLSHTICVE